MSSVKLTSAAALEGYVRTINLNFLTMFYYGFASAPFLNFHFGVKGKELLTTHLVNTLFRRYQSEFTPVANAHEFAPRWLEVEAAKIDLKIIPQNFENAYLGIARAPGFNHIQMPFEQFILDQTFAKKNEEMEDAIWNGVKAAIPSNNDTLDMLFDGFLKIIIDGLAANDPNFTAVATGALTLNDCVEQFESVYKALHTSMRTKEIYMYCSVANRDLYAESYRENYSKNYVQKTINGLEAIRLDFGNAWVVPIPGMGDSDRIIATFKDNMIPGTDAMDDSDMLNFQDSHRDVDMWADMKFGAQIGILNNRVIAVNNQE